MGLYTTSSQVLAQTSDNTQTDMLNYHSQMNHLARRNFYNWSPGWNGWNGWNGWSGWGGWRGWGAPPTPPTPPTPPSPVWY